MQAFDLVLRAAAGSVLLGLALLLVLRAPRARLVGYLVPFALCLAGFLARNTPYPELLPTGVAAAVASLLSGVAAVFVWWFCAAVFDDDFRPGPVEKAVAALWITLAVFDRALPWFGLPDAELSPALVAIGLGIVVAFSWRVVRGLDDDLVEGRRRARWLAAAGVVGLLGSDVAVDLAMGFDWKPPAFIIAQNAAVLVFVLLLANWMLRPAAMLVSQPAPRPARPTLPAPESGDARLQRRLDQLMAVEKAYLDPSLTFAEFARRMGTPEAAVRAFVHHELGYRHFRTFLNAYRVEAARRALADPNGEPKVASVAFDAGFASLASFNRVFKDAVGVAPSEYRASALSDASEKPGKSF